MLLQHVCICVPHQKPIYDLPDSLMSAHLAEQLRGRVVCLAFSATAEITQLTGCSQRNVETPPRFRTESDTQEIHFLVAVAGQLIVRTSHLSHPLLMPAHPCSSTKFKSNCLKHRILKSRLPYSCMILPFQCTASLKKIARVYKRV